MTNPTDQWIASQNLETLRRMCSDRNIKNVRKLTKAEAAAIVKRLY